jgi:hypothetical protein
MTRQAILGIAAVVGLACGQAADPLPNVKNPPAPVVASMPRPAFTVLVRDVSGLNAVFVVVTPDAPNTTPDAMLRVADYLAQDLDPVVQTIVIFRDPTRFVPARSLHRAEEYSLSFAVATALPLAHIRQVRVGTVN